MKHFEENRNCGDSLTVYLLLASDGTVESFSFDGKTAIVTTACASVVGEAIIGMPMAEVLTLGYDFVIECLGMEVSSRRKRAAVLGILAVRNAMHAYLADGISDDFSDVLEE